jgi:hypothetical protein
MGHTGFNLPHHEAKQPVQASGVSEIRGYFLS